MNANTAAMYTSHILPAHGFLTTTKQGKIDIKLSSNQRHAQITVHYITLHHPALHTLSYIYNQEQWELSCACTCMYHRVHIINREVRKKCLQQYRNSFLGFWPGVYKRWTAFLIHRESDTSATLLLGNLGHSAISWFMKSSGITVIQHFLCVWGIHGNQK